MKLNNSQIEDLYAFTIKHFVEHYDLQTELVDHLANDIEAIWETEPNLPYTDARDKAFKKFGVFGFMDAISERQKAMSKRYYKYLWNELKQWFNLPKVLKTMSLFILFYVLFSLEFGNYFTITAFVLIMFWVSYRSIVLNREFRKRKTVSNKKWLLEEILFKQAGGTVFILLSQFFNVLNWCEKYPENQNVILVIALLFTFLYLFNYISFKVLPNKAEKLLNETYPEFSL